jgi:protoporphyrin/coproporphyrin ferrochelatase
MSKKTGVLLIQLGTPDSPSKKDVGRYLLEFLNDPRVIDINPVGRAALVNLIIVPFRTPKSAKIYEQVWTKDGSPLLIYTKSVKEKLQKQLGEAYTVEIAMRYKNPSLENVLERMKKANYDRIIILPLFPQYASATTGSAIEKAIKIISRWWVIPELKVINQFYDNEGYINSVVEVAKKYDYNDYDHVVFSYHGLPERQVDKVYVDGIKCNDHNCEEEITDENKFCYKATCYATTRYIVERLNIPKDKYTVSFQSRLDEGWIRPYSDDIVVEQAKKGAKRLLMFSPAFVADCLETIVEIGIEYQHLFKEHGGEKVQLVESLNDHPMWVDALEDIIKKA